jgi:hypothetical protein
VAADGGGGCGGWGVNLCLLQGHVLLLLSVAVSGWVSTHA